MSFIAECMELFGLTFTAMWSLPVLRFFLASMLAMAVLGLVLLVSSKVKP